MTDEYFSWGKENTHASQGWYIRSLVDRRYISCSWSNLFDTHERDGPITHRGNHVWLSAGGKTISMLKCIINDYGELVPVEYS